MRKIWVINISLIFALITSCTEVMDLNLPKDTRPVVEGLVTNEAGPYYIRLTESRNLLYYHRKDDPNYEFYPELSGAEPITNATLVISSSDGEVDTLTACVDSLSNYDPSVVENRYAISHGYYQTNKLKGETGITYSLKILWKNKEYHASGTMLNVPEIDSVSFVRVKAEEGKDDYYIPKIYFDDPEHERNYYLFKFTDNNSVWGYSVLSDEFLGGYVNGLDVFKGQSANSWVSAYPMSGEKFVIKMYSLEEDGFKFYKAIIDQFNNDGGTYSPAPTSPPTNIDNGGLGFFRASAVTSITSMTPVN